MEERFFYCPSCNAGFTYSDEFAEQKVQCSECGEKFYVPRLEQIQSHPPPDSVSTEVATNGYEDTEKNTRQHVQSGGGRRAVSSAGRKPHQPKHRTSPAPRRKKSFVPLFVVLILFAAGGAFFIFNRSSVKSKRVILLDENRGSQTEADATDTAVTRIVEQEEIAPVLKQPVHDSGPYSGYDLAGIEPIVSNVEHLKEPWRREAEKRIEKYRKADIKVKVTDASGAPLPSAEVSLKLIKHKFIFGGIINAAKFRNNEAFYKKIFLNMGFNSSGFCNALKYKLWRGAQRRKPGEIIEWLHSKGISVRGHCLIWPGMSQSGTHIPKELYKFIEEYRKAPSTALKEKIAEVSNDIVRKWVEKWDVFEWDVINETRGNHVIQDIIGKEIEAEWFRTAAKYARNGKIGLLLNENRVVTSTPQRKKITETINGKRKTRFIYKNEVRAPNVVKYYENVKELLKNGAPINTLGLQSRCQAKLAPEVLYNRLCVFDEFNIPIVATEFEITPKVGDELEKADMAEKLMTVYFSHRLVKGIYAWSLFPTEDGRQILNTDGTPNLRGKVWLYLIKNRWSTHVSLATDKSGQAVISGFKGQYEIVVKYRGRTKKLEAEINDDKSIIIKF